MTEMSELITLHLYAEDYDLKKSWQLVEWCLSQGADEWTISQVTVQKENTPLFDQFDAATAALRRPTVVREHLTAYSHNGFTRPANLWTLTPAAFPVLQEFLPLGPFAYQSGPEGWFEDLEVYRRGELMLGVVSHEQEGVLRVTESERTLLIGRGFPFRVNGSYVGY